MWLLKALRGKSKRRPIYVDDVIVGWDDGLPNSIKIDKDLLANVFSDPFCTIDQGGLIGLWGKGYAGYFGAEWMTTRKVYADKCIRSFYAACIDVSTGGSYLRCRDRLPKWVENVYNCYWAEVAQARATSDFALWKTVAGTGTQLATEAVDIAAEERVWVELGAVGTTLKGWRNASVGYPDEVNTTTPNISVTDTSIASGTLSVADEHSRYTPSTYWGAVNYWMNAWVLPQALIADAPSSAMPKAVAYFEVPVEEFILPEIDEHGFVNLTTHYFGVKMPEEIVELEKPTPKLLDKKVSILKAKGWTTEEIKAFMPEAYPVERINRLALTHSSLIPTDKSGKPIHGTAITRIYHASSPELHPIEKRIQALKEMRGVRQLSREEAISLALKMDDKLHIHDLVPCTKHDLGGKCFKEYCEWRIATVGDKPEFAEADIRKHFVKGEKGW